MMQKILGAMATLAIATGLPAPIRADEPPRGETTGWTGITNPRDVIVARRALMMEMQRLMRPLEASSVGQGSALEEQQSAAITIAQVMLAVPHLFPPTTNLYDAAATTPVTLALPAIWEQFSAFSALSATASAAATKLASLNDADELRAGALAVRAACDACHAPFLRPYVPETVRSEDLEFDFDALFEDNDAPAEKSANPE
jgi:cytochrome c556